MIRPFRCDLRSKMISLYLNFDPTSPIVSLLFMLRLWRAWADITIGHSFVEIELSLEDVSAKRSESPYLARLLISIDPKAKKGDGIPNKVDFTWECKPLPANN